MDILDSERGPEGSTITMRFLPAALSRGLDKNNYLQICSSCKVVLLRFGQVNKYLSNTNVIEHSGKLYTIAENHLPQEIDILTLKALDMWDVNGAWNLPFTSHPKKAPGTGELVTFGISATKPYAELGVISADGKELVHRVDLKLNRCPLSHEILVTQRYNVFLDYALTVDLGRLLLGGS
ncbi:Carotenoid oxygenase - like 10 [Theobroma cacao]|nr:Carotenoid oxygenase - like 10 [Theobroma cacao]